MVRRGGQRPLAGSGGGQKKIDPPPPSSPAARRILLPTTVKEGMYQPVQGLPGGVMPPPGAVGGRAGNALRSYYRAHGS